MCAITSSTEAFNTKGENVWTHERACLPVSDPSGPGGWPNDGFGAPPPHGAGGALAVIMPAIGMVYMFHAMSVIVDDYLITGLELASERWKLSEGVASVTVMAVAGSFPQIAGAFWGTVVGHSDIGTGLCMGSTALNLIAILGLCGFFSLQMLALAPWKIVRDASACVAAVLLLVLITLDGIVEWYESLYPIILYAGYVCAVKYDNGVQRWALNVVQCRPCRGKRVGTKKVLPGGADGEGGVAGGEGGGGGEGADTAGAVGPEGLEAGEGTPAGEAEEGATARGEGEGEEVGEEDGDEPTAPDGSRSPTGARRQQRRDTIAEAEAATVFFRDTRSHALIDMVRGNMDIKDVAPPKREPRDPRAMANFRAAGCLVREDLYGQIRHRKGKRILEGERFTVCGGGTSVLQDRVSLRL